LAETAVLAFERWFDKLCILAVRLTCAFLRRFRSAASLPATVLPLGSRLDKRGIRWWNTWPVFTGRFATRAAFFNVCGDRMATLRGEPIIDENVLFLGLLTIMMAKHKCFFELRLTRQKCDVTHHTYHHGGARLQIASFAVESQYLYQIKMAQNAASSMDNGLDSFCKYKVLGSIPRREGAFFARVR